MINELLEQVAALTAELAAAVEENRKRELKYARLVAELDKVAHERSKLHEQLQDLMVRKWGHA